MTLAVEKAGGEFSAGWALQIKGESQMRVLRILIVDDEEPICELLKDTFRKQGHLVLAETSGEKALETARSEPFDVVFLDIKMPGLNGVETLKQMRRILPKAEFIMITGFAASELVDESLSSGAFVCLSKPFSLNQLTDMIEDLSLQEALPKQSAGTIR